jgi:leucine dehydrogenase
VEILSSAWRQVNASQEKQGGPSREERISCGPLLPQSKKTQTEHRIRSLASAKLSVAPTAGLSDTATTMNLLQEMSANEHEQVIAFQNNATGLRGFLAIHDTTLGPALGGIRIWPYKSEDEALADALRLSRAMTYKTALAELPAGGGKAVIILHSGLDRPGAFEAFGALVESLRGRFFTGQDVGITPADLQAVGRATRYVACESSPELGDISEQTAIGIWHGMRACLEFAGLRHARVAIQGAGSVGAWLGKILKREGMELLVADIDATRAAAMARELGARVVAPEEIYSADCDVFAPCALGGVINHGTIPQLKARIVCGSANNVLATPEDGEALARRDILFAPDYLVNAGGVIRGADFYLLGHRDSGPSLARIYDRMKRVLEIARERGVSTARVADELAEARWKKKPKVFRDLCWGAPAPPRGSCETS